MVSILEKLLCTMVILHTDAVIKSLVALFMYTQFSMVYDSCLLISIYILLHFMSYVVVSMYP